MSLRHTVGRAAGAALTVALMGVAVPATAAPAPVHEGRAVAVAENARAVAAEGEKPSRAITLDGEKTGPGRFRIMGQVSPRYAKGVVLVERKLGTDGAFEPYKKLTTTKRSRYGTSVAPRKEVGRVTYRVRTRETSTYAESFGDHVYVIRTRRA